MKNFDLLLLEAKNRHDHGDLDAFDEYLVDATYRGRPIIDTLAHWLYHTDAGKAWAANVKVPHHWDYCIGCGPMVRCGTCGNNSCNGAYGRLPRGTAVWDGENNKCPDCPAAYLKQETEQPPIEVVAMENDPFVVSRREIMAAASVDIDSFPMTDEQLKEIFSTQDVFADPTEPKVDPPPTQEP